MSDKMREALIDQDGAVWEKIGGAWSLYKPAQSAAVPEHIRSIKIPTDAMEQEFQKHYRRGYEAGKGDAVPVVGEPVAWGVTKRHEDNVWFISDSRFTAQYYAQMYAHRIGENPDQVVIPLYRKPTTSISADELERLQRNDARYLWMRNHTSFNYSVHKAAEVGGIELDQATDAAIVG